LAIVKGLTKIDERCQLVASEFGNVSLGIIEVCPHFADVSIRQSVEQAFVYTSARRVLYLYALLTGYYTNSLKAQPTSLHHHICRGGESCLEEVPRDFGERRGVSYMG
jgi:hypothetical protein